MHLVSNKIAEPSWKMPCSKCCLCGVKEMLNLHQSNVLDRTPIFCIRGWPIAVKRDGKGHSEWMLESNVQSFGPGTHVKSATNAKSNMDVVEDCFFGASCANQDAGFLETKGTYRSMISTN